MYIRKHPAPPIGRFLRGADLPPFVTKRWRQKCPQGTSVGIGRRFSLSGHKRLRCFARPLRALEPPSDLIPPPVQCGICGALRATMIICWSPVLTGLRPAGSHCENSGSSDGSGASARSDRAKSEVFRDRSASAGVVIRYFSPCLIFWRFWIKPKARKKNFKRR